MRPRFKNGELHQHGTTTVEFALIAIIFFTLLIGIMEMGRLMWTWNAAVEATRLGARLAVVCSMNDSMIATRMREMLPALAVSNITIDYLDPPSAANTCTVNSCKYVRVSLSGYTHLTVIPVVGTSIPIPEFQTTLPREAMNSAANPVCS
jgi:Flp pilus assembly protein TadG